MLKKLILCLTLILCVTLPAFANINVSGTPFYYSGESGEYYKFRPVRINLINGYNSYKIHDISDLTVTMTNTTTNHVIPVTQQITDNGTYITVSFTDGLDYITENGSYQLVFSGLDKIKCYNSANQDEIVLVSDIYDGCKTSWTHSFVISSAYTRTFTITYPDPTTQPGDCSMIGGSYSLMMINPASTLTHDYRTYTRDSSASDDNTGWVEDENGNKITDATFTYKGILFTLTPQKTITTPGTYYLIYPTDGTLDYYSTTGSLSGKNHISHLKIGPYKVDPSSSTTTIPAQILSASIPTYYTDALPEKISLYVNNAANLEFKDEDTEHQASLSIRYTNTDGTIVYDYTTYATTYSIDGINLDAAFPAEAFQGAGTYAVRWTVNVGNDLTGFSSARQQLDFSRTPTYSVSLRVVEPNPAVDDVKLYRQAETADEIEIGDDETINIRLDHKSASSGISIYYKWTPDNETPAAINHTLADNDLDGFTLHSGDIEISSPGRLEYYTLHSSTPSEIKTISIVAKPTSAISDITADKAVSNLTGALPGIYSLSGLRLSANPDDAPEAAGLYIKVNPDGKATKIIVR